MIRQTRPKTVTNKKSKIARIRRYLGSREDNTVSYLLRIVSGNLPRRDGNSPAWAGYSRPY